MTLERNISPSLINYIKSCPRRYNYDLQGVPQLPIYIKQADLGSQMHNIIKLYFSEIGDNPQPNHIKNTAYAVFDTYYTLDSQKIKAKHILDNFIKHEVERSKTQNPYKPQMIEQRLVATPETIQQTLHVQTPTPFVTHIDFYHNKTWIDWKTGNTTMMTEELQFQYGFSKLMLELNGYPVEKAYFMSLSSGMKLIPPQTTEGWTLKRIKETLSIIETKNFRKHESFLCNYCPYQIRCVFEGTCLWI